MKKIPGILVCMILMMPLFATTAMANEPPTAPDIDGPTSGKAEVPQEYTFTSTDPNGDDIFYCVEWGCGDETCSDFVTSGEPVTLSHTYSQGAFTIRAKATDTNEAESDWSELEITMPRNRHVTNLFLFRILHQFPNAFPILRHILRL